VAGNRFAFSSTPVEVERGLERHGSFASPVGLPRWLTGSTRVEL
jgi:hypothetical protein